MDENGNQGNGQEQNPEVLTLEQVQELIARETAGLKTNRDNVLNEKKTLEAELESLRKEREQISPLLEMLNAQKKDQKLKAIIDGKMTLEEYEQQVRAGLQDQWQSEVSAKEAELEALRAEMQKEREQIVRNNVKNEVGSAYLGHKYARKEAMSDLLALAEREVSFKDGRVVILDDNGNERLIGGKPMSMDQWIEEQSQKRPYFFNLPSGSGSGSQNNGVPGGRKTVSMSQWDNMISEAYTKGNHAELLRALSAGEIVVQ